MKNMDKTNKPNAETRGRKALFEVPMQRASVSIPVIQYRQLTALSRKTGVPIAVYLRRYVLTGLQTDRSSHVITADITEPATVQPG